MKTLKFILDVKAPDDFDKDEVWQALVTLINKGYEATASYPGDEPNFIRKLNIDNPHLLGRFIGHVHLNNEKYDVLETVCEHYGFTDVEVMPHGSVNEKILLLIAGQIELCATSGIIDGEVWSFTRFEKPVEQK